MIQNALRTAVEDCNTKNSRITYEVLIYSTWKFGITNTSHLNIYSNKVLVISIFLILTSVDNFRSLQFAECSLSKFWSDDKVEVTSYACDVESLVS